MDNIIKSLREQISKSTPFAKLFLIIYGCFVSPLVKSVIAFIFTTAISVEAKLGVWWLFGVNAFIYLVFLWIFYIVEKYRKVKYEECISLTEVAHQNNVLNSTIAKETRRVIRDITNGQPVGRSTLSRITYQDICSLVCQAIYHVLANSLHRGANAGMHVTIFAKTTESSRREKIQMVAFANHDQDSPIGYEEDVYYLDEYPDNDKNKKDYYHKCLFRINQNEIAVLVDKTEVEKYFLINEKNAAREKQVVQYIGIPVFCPIQGMISLLQIDTKESYLFGKTEQECRDFGRTFKLFINKILVYYYQEYLFDILFSELSIKEAHINSLIEKTKGGDRVETK